MKNKMTKYVRVLQVGFNIDVVGAKTGKKLNKVEKFTNNAVNVTASVLALSVTVGILWGIPLMWFIKMI